MAGWEGVDPSKWAIGTTAGMTALLRNSVQGLGMEAATTLPNGGRVPVKSGNLARSVIIDNKPPVQGKPGQQYTAQDLALGVSKIVPGKDVFVGWQADYSRRQNNGFVGTDSLGRMYNQAGFGFAEATAAKWPAIVTREATKIVTRRSA